MRAKVVEARVAVESVRDGATVAVSGSGGGLLEPDAILEALERRFLQTGHPRDLTLVHALGIGDGKSTGLLRLAHEGLLKRVIGGHWSWGPALQAMARDDLIEAYTFPAGVIVTLFREIGAGRPGVITHIGLGTFADPEHGGGKVNARATEDLVERVTFDGRPYLRYKPFRIDVGLVRGSAADPWGSLTLMNEPADLEAHAVALGAHNSGGRVIAQVRSVLSGQIVPARLARIPGVLVDDVVVAPHQWQCAVSQYDPAISGQAGPTGADAVFDMPTGIRRIVAWRAARELREGESVNFGYGIPGGIPGILHEEGRIGTYWGSVEQGIHNGQPMDGVMFGAARYPHAIVPSSDQFDFYSGGGVDVAFLGMGEMDADGNVNVSWLGDSIVGPGGFVDITQGAKKVVFCGTFEAKGLEVEARDGRLRIRSAGQVPKLVEQVRHISFSGWRAREQGQEVLYVTERAVFRLVPGGIELVEAAEGVDVRRDILDRMRFTPLVGTVRPMALERST
ncbi:MAG: CoA-transferase [Burkholderiales bacterium]